MGIRIHNEDYVHFVTNRCEHEMFFMLPTKEINQLITYWLARAKQQYGPHIQLFAFIFLSNHYHMLLKDPNGELPAFIGYFQANVAKAINKQLNRHGKFWSREYDDVIVDGEQEFWNRFVYTSLNAVKSGLVENAEDWSGVHSLDYILENKTVVCKGTNQSKFYNANRFKKADENEFKETYTFRLSPAPMHEKLTIEERNEYIKQLLKSGSERYRKLRDFENPLGMENVFAQHPQDRPKKASRKPRFKFMSFCKERQVELKESYKAFVGRYKECFNVFLKQSSNSPDVKPRTAQGKIYWPKGCFPPTCRIPVTT